MKKYDLTRITISAKIFWVLSFIILITLNACKKDKDSSDPNNENPQDISFLDTEIHPSQLALLHIKKGTKSLTANIAGKNLDVKILNDSTAYFLTPEIPDGNYQLMTSLGNLSINIIHKTSLSEKTVFDGLESKLALIENNPLFSTEEIEEAVKFNEDVKKIFSSLSNEQKREALMIYSANRDFMLKDVSKITNLALTAQPRSSNVPYHKYASAHNGTALNNSSGIPKMAANYNYDSQWVKGPCELNYYSGDIKQAMGCSVREINSQYQGLISPLIHFSAYSIITAHAILAGPATFGVSTVYGSLAAATAVYILFAEIRPYILILKKNVASFLSEKWVLASEKISAIEQNINTADRYTLSDYFSRRTMSISDSFTGSLGTFVSLKNQIKEMMQPYRQIFGDMPDYVNTEVNIASEDIIWSVNDISSSNITVKKLENNKIDFELKNKTEETFTYKLQGNYLGQIHVVNVQAKIRNGYNEDYTVLFADSYHPDYSKINGFNSYKEGDMLNVHTNVIYQYKVLYKGVPVTNTSTPSLFNIRQIQFGDAPKNNQDIYRDDYPFEFFDEVNRRNVTLYFKVKISNEVYDKVVGKTLNFANPAVSPMKYKLTFLAGGKLIVELEGGNQPIESSWGFSVMNNFWFQTCTDGSEFLRRTIGSVSIGYFSAALPTYMLIYADGSYAGNGGSACGGKLTIN